jgi:hypothetical protein
MAEVTGSIGNEYVELNNAATEATLKQLLAAVKAQGGAGAAGAAAGVAGAAGLDKAAIKSASDGLKTVGNNAATGSSALTKLGQAGSSVADGFSKFGSTLNPLIGKLIQGNAGLSDMLGPLQKLPGALGIFGSALTKAAEYQEANLKVYQQITQSGANFGGSLTDLRQAALNSYMSLEGFGTFVKSNSEALARMGGSVDGGTRNFVKLSNELIKSDAGTKLMALGYTTDQINGTMAAYIASTGGRTKQEMQNTQALATATASYMTELDALTQFTGASKEKLAEEAKKAAQNEAFQRKLSTMDEAERAKLKAAYDKAAASGIAGATDLVISTSLGLPPVTKAAQTLSGVAPQVATGFNNMTKSAMDQNKTMKDVNAEYGRTLISARRAGEEFGKTGDALSTMPGEYGTVMNGLIGAENKLRTQGINSEEEYSQRQDEIRKNIEEQQKSQANDMARSQKAIAEIGQIINNMLAPAISLLTSFSTKLVEKIAGAVKWFDELGTGWKVLMAAGAALTAWMLRDIAVKKAAQAAETLKNKVGGALAKPGATPANPLYVVVVGRGGKGAGGAGGPDLGDLGGGKDGTGGKDGGKKAGKMGKFGKIAGGVGGLLGGVALDLAQEKLTESGHEKLGAGAGIGSAALTGAGMGAFLGPAGAAIGGALGAGYGLYQNWDTLFGKGGEIPKHAAGGIATKPSMGIFGEAGPEAILPLSKIGDLLGSISPVGAALTGGGIMGNAISSMVGGGGSKGVESLQSELARLNKQTEEMLKYLKETAESTRRNVDATNSLSGDLFKF